MQRLKQATTTGGGTLGQKKLIVLHKSHVLTVISIALKKSCVPGPKSCIHFSKKDQLHYHELLLPRAERHYSEASENDPSAPVFGITREHRSWEQQAPVLPKRQTPMERPNDAQRAGFLQAEMHHPAAREYVFAAYARAPPMDMDFRMFVDKDIPTHQMLDQMSRIPMVNDKHVHDTRPFMQHPDSMDLHRGMLGPHRMDLI